MKGLAALKLAGDNQLALFAEESSANSTDQLAALVDVDVVGAVSFYSRSCALIGLREHRPQAIALKDLTSIFVFHVVTMIAHHCYPSLFDGMSIPH